MCLGCSGHMHTDTDDTGSKPNGLLLELILLPNSSTIIDRLQTPYRYSLRRQKHDPKLKSWWKIHLRKSSHTNSSFGHPSLSWKTPLQERLREASLSLSAWQLVFLMLNINADAKLLSEWKCRDYLTSKKRLTSAESERQRKRDIHYHNPNWAKLFATVVEVCRHIIDFN